jgi:hypothetical protein
MSFRKEKLIARFKAFLIVTGIVVWELKNDVLSN